MPVQSYSWIGRVLARGGQGVKLLGCSEHARLINTKQPTKATAAATKQNLYPDEELEKKWSEHEQRDTDAGHTVPGHREKWVARETKKFVKEEIIYPVHTCETKEEFWERKRDTFFQYPKDPEIGQSIPVYERGIFHLFTRTKGMSLENVQLMRAILHVDTQTLKGYQEERLWLAHVDDQKYLVERVKALGPDLAAAHFIVYRGGRVRFHGSSEWLQLDKYDECADLPRHKVDNLHVKDIDASGVELLHEGLENFAGCQYLESLNLSNSPYADNFFIDRICNQHADCLQSLDISDCRHISLGGITALCRLKKLRHLNVQGLCIEHLPLACLTLEDENPDLTVSGVSFILEEIDQMPQEEVDVINARLAALRNVGDVTPKK